MVYLFIYFFLLMIRFFTQCIKFLYIVTIYDVFYILKKYDALTSDTFFLSYENFLSITQK